MKTDAVYHTSAASFYIWPLCMHTTISFQSIPQSLIHLFSHKFSHTYNSMHTLAILHIFPCTEPPRTRSPCHTLQTLLKEYRLIQHFASKHFLIHLPSFHSPAQMHTLVAFHSRESSIGVSVCLDCRLGLGLSNSMFTLEALNTQYRPPIYRGDSRGCLSFG